MIKTIKTDSQGATRADFLRYLVASGVPKDGVSVLLADSYIQFDVMVIDAMGDNIDLQSDEVNAVLARAIELGYDQ